MESVAAYSLVDNQQTLPVEIAPSALPQEELLAPEDDTAQLILRCLQCSVAQRMAGRANRKPIQTAAIARCAGVSEYAVQAAVEHVEHVAVTKTEAGTVAVPQPLFRIPNNEGFCASRATTDEGTAFLTPLSVEDFRPRAMLSTGGNFKTPPLTEDQKQHSVLSSEQEIALADIIQSPTSTVAEIENAVDTFLAHNVRLAYKVAVINSLHRRFLTFDEAVGAALEGISRAVYKFESRGNKFSSYAVVAAEREIQRAASQSAGIPDFYYALLPRLHVCFQEFVAKYGTAPNTIELALAAGISAITVKHTREVCAPFVGRISLDTPTETDTSSKPMSTHAVVGNTDNGYADVEFDDVLKKFVATLSPFEQSVLAQLLGLSDDSQHKIARDYGVSQKKVQTTAEKIASQMRHPYYGLMAGIPGYDWQADAACAKADNLAATTHTTPEAKANCADCPVQKQCHNLALSSDKPVTNGTWGGYSARAIKTARKGLLRHSLS